MLTILLTDVSQCCQILMLLVMANFLGRVTLLTKQTAHPSSQGVYLWLACRRRWRALGTALFQKAPRGDPYFPHHPRQHDMHIIVILLVMNIFFSSFNNVDLLHSMLVDCCMPRRQGHHEGRGRVAAAIVGMCVFYLALASFNLGTLCVRCLPTQYPTTNQPPSHLNISINNTQIRTFYEAILCACMVGRRLCSMGSLFHYLGVGGSRWSTRNKWHVCVFYLPLASFYLGTLCVRCPPTQHPTNNQPPSHLNIPINNKRMMTFYATILCACMVGRCLCSMVALFHYLGVSSSWWSSRLMEKLAIKSGDWP